MLVIFTGDKLLGLVGRKSLNKFFDIFDCGGRLLLRQNTHDLHYFFLFQLVFLWLLRRRPLGLLFLLHLWESSWEIARWLFRNHLGDLWLDYRFFAPRLELIGIPWSWIFSIRDRIALDLKSWLQNDHISALIFHVGLQAIWSQQASILSVDLLCVWILQWPRLWLNIAIIWYHVSGLLYDFNFGHYLVLNLPIVTSILGVSLFWVFHYFLRILLDHHQFSVGSWVFTIDWFPILTDYAESLVHFVGVHPLNIFCVLGHMVFRGQLIFLWCDSFCCNVPRLCSNVD